MTSVPQEERQALVFDATCLSHYRVLSRINVVPVTVQIARRAGELLGTTGLAGHRCAIDAVVAATALGLERPIVLLTSDLDDLNTLVGEPDRSEAERIVAVRV